VRYPYERFLRFLVSRKVDLNLKLGKLGLPSVGPLWIGECRSHIRKTAPSSVIRYLDSDDNTVVLQNGFLEWAQAEGIREFWEAQPEFGGRERKEHTLALRLFNVPYARGVLGMLLASKASREEIIEIAQQRLEIVIDDSVVSFYERCFFDKSLMDRETWPSYLNALPSKEERHLITFGLQSPSSEESRYQVGLPVSVDVDLIKRTMLTESYMRWKDAINSPNSPGQDVFKWAEEVRKTLQIMGDAGGKGKDGDKSELPTDFAELFSVKVEKIPIPRLADLQGEVAEITSLPKAASKGK
jgi:hypothetical protein